MKSEAVGIAMKAAEALKIELEAEFRSIKENNSEPGYYSLYVDPEYKKIYSWYRLSEEDSEPGAVQKGHDVRLLMIDEKDFKDLTFDVDKYVKSAMEAIALRLKSLELDIKDCEVII